MTPDEINVTRWRLGLVFGRIKDYCAEAHTQAQDFIGAFEFDCGPTAQTLAATLDARLAACGTDPEALEALCIQLDTAIAKLVDSEQLPWPKYQQLLR